MTGPFRGLDPGPPAPEAGINHNKALEWLKFRKMVGPFRGLNPGPPAPEAGIIPLDQTDKSTLPVQGLEPWYPAWKASMITTYIIPESNTLSMLPHWYKFTFTVLNCIVQCFDRESNTGPSDLQSDALPTELSKQLIPSPPAPFRLSSMTHLEDQSHWSPPSRTQWWAKYIVRWLHVAQWGGIARCCGYCRRLCPQWHCANQLFPEPEWWFTYIGTPHPHQWRCVSHMQGCA